MGAPQIQACQSRSPCEPMPIPEARKTSEGEKVTPKGRHEVEVYYKTCKMQWHKMQENLEHFKGRNEYGESLQTQGHSFSYEHKKNAGQYKESKRALFTLRKLL